MLSGGQVVSLVITFLLFGGFLGFVLGASPWGEFLREKSQKHHR